MIGDQAEMPGVSKMNSFDKWLLKGILRRTIIQGPDHHKWIRELYFMIRDACKNEFYEDNEVTMDDYLNEWFQQTQYENKYHLLQ